MSAPTVAPSAEGARPRTRKRLLVALLLIGLALCGLAAMELVRERTPTLPVPHEPAQALMGTFPGPAPAHDSPASPAPAVEPPPPPVVVNEPPLPEAAPNASPPPHSRTTESKAGYVVQAGVFTSASNAKSLQRRLKDAGLRVKVETRVQLGPYPDRRAAQQALDKLRQLGVDGVMVPAR